MSLHVSDVLLLDWSSTAWEGTRRGTARASLTEYLERPGLDRILQSIFWEGKLLVFQVMMEALVSQTHGEAPSFLVVSSLPTWHFPAPPEPDVADRCRTITGKAWLLPEYLTTFQKMTVVLSVLINFLCGPERSMKHFQVQLHLFGEMLTWLLREIKDRNPFQVFVFWKMVLKC